MDIYAIVSKKTECFGHGSYDEVSYIPHEGPYESGPFLPLFVDKEEAIRYMAANKVLTLGCTVEKVLLCTGSRPWVNPTTQP